MAKKTNKGGNSGAPKDEDVTTNGHTPVNRIASQLKPAAESPKPTPVVNPVAAVKQAALVAASTEEELAAALGQMVITVNGQSALAEPREFSTGSVGWYLSNKVNVKLPDGTMETVQISGNFTITKSKERRIAAKTAKTINKD